MEQTHDPIDLRGTQGSVVLPHGTVVQNYEGGQQSPTLDDRLALQAQQIAKLSDDVAQVKLQINAQDMQRLLFERTLKDALADAVATIRNDLGALRTQAVRLPRSRSTVFVVAWLFLFAPVPLFYQEVRAISGFHWTGSLLVVVLAYVCSAGLFAYLFGLFDNQVN